MPDVFYRVFFLINDDDDDDDDERFAPQITQFL